MAKPSGNFTNTSVPVGEFRITMRYSATMLPEAGIVGRDLVSRILRVFLNQHLNLVLASFLIQNTFV
jgi:hypothetical protein